MKILLTAIALSLGSVNSLNSTKFDETEDTCDASAFGPWSQALENWATSSHIHSDRHGRVMALPSTKGYYVTERFDNPFMAPPPPPPAQTIMTPQGVSHGPSPGYISPPAGHMIPHGNRHVPSHTMHMPQGYKEWEGTPPPPGGGKIVNRPPKPVKDQFKPSYYPPAQNQRPGNTIDRVDDPPRKQVTETDLYLLSAIEKLVYRVDLMEKRLRKMEEGVHYLLVGSQPKPDPCPVNFTRVRRSCYSWSRQAVDWKSAAVACRQQNASLLELRDPDQTKALYKRLLSDSQVKDADFWTGGLNPGLLWIWSQSARPVEGDPVGEGRCLAMVPEASRGSYALRGRDCAVTLSYVCQKDDERVVDEKEKHVRDNEIPLERTTEGSTP